MFQLVAKIILHLIWVVPLSYGRVYFALAAVLGIALIYIKTFKLTAAAQELDAKGLGESAECIDLRKHRDRWRRWTFLPGGS